jgi:hypothetical protein
MNCFQVLLFMSTCGATCWAANYFALVPEHTVPNVWNIFTAGYYEMSLVGAVVDMLGVMYLGRLVEPIWQGGC